MALNIEDMFNPQGKEKMLSRINALTPSSKALWGKMSVGQMLAHCNVAYEIVHEPVKHSPPGPIDKFFARVFAKGTVVGDKPYPQNGPTAPMFVIKDSRDFDVEKTRLIGYINKTFQQGATHYDGLENMTFGKLSSKQWNTLFSKHLDHHLRQFGV
jgi:murein endopeptidase